MSYITNPYLSTQNISTFSQTKYPNSIENISYIMPGKSEIYSFSKKEQEIINLMSVLGMNKHFSRVVVFLSRIKESTSRDIQNSIGLKQSEVSVILRSLRERGWLTTEFIQTTKRGRPTQKHKLKYHIGSIVKYIEADKMAEIRDIKKIIARLKKLAR